MDNELKILLAIVAVIIIYCFVTGSQSKKDKETFNASASAEVMPWSANTNSYGEMDILDDGENGNIGLHFNMCSPSCCSPQYPPPFPLPVDPMICMSEQEFVPSSYSCRNEAQNAGCMCMTKEQSTFLGSRGGNA
jgi:hypothetical protein